MKAAIKSRKGRWKPSVDPVSANVVVVKSFIHAMQYGVGESHWLKHVAKRPHTNDL